VWLFVVSGDDTHPKQLPGHRRPGRSGRMRSKGFYPAAFLGANLVSVWDTSKTVWDKGNAEDEDEVIPP